MIKTAQATLKSVKSSPVKVMKITKNITGRPVSEVLMILQFSNLKLAPVIRALVYSAMANAENNHDMNIDDLYVKEINVGRAFALRRFAARGRGKSSRILKTFSNIKVILAQYDNDKETNQKLRK
ncbi:50S ribosomal protein L22 [Alphaproteobacteria bacterium]|nr:50S ribosomal protein L22 [Alphaproteobacteria bacterium]